MTETQQPERLQLAVSFRVRAAQLAAAVLPDVVGLAAFALVCRGVYLVWGSGWTYIAVGAPLVAVYAWRELRAPTPKRGEG